MKKFLKQIFCGALVSCFVTSGVACNKDKNGDDKPINDPYAINLVDDNFTYFESFKMNSDKKLKVFGSVEKLSNVDLVLTTSIQGLFAQTAVEYYYQNTSYHKLWLDDLCANYGITYETVTLNDMVADYINRYGNDAGYILFDNENNPESKNVAVSICGIRGWVPVDVSLKSKVEEMGLTQKLDVTDKGDRWCFENYKDEFNKSGLCQYKTGSRVPECDYAVACKYYCFYQTSEELDALLLRDEVQDWTDDDSPVFGWGPIDEMSHVIVSSEHGNFTIASDWSSNLTVFGCKDYYGISELKQKLQYTRKEVEQKHYVCVVCSDGDNIQALSNTLAPDPSKKYFRADRADFPMGWNISPSALDIQPTLQKYIYNMIGSQDYFVGAVSGQGYINPSIYPYLSDFCGRLATYLKKGDLKTIQILDSQMSEDMIEYYSRVPGLEGVQCMIGNYYAEEKGSVYWADNGMPFVTCRLSLWEPETGLSLANKINSFPVDPTSIEGYTLVNLHPWSRGYGDVVEMYENLNDNVEIVTSEQFFQLIKENVPHVDVSLKD